MTKCKRFDRKKYFKDYCKISINKFTILNEKFFIIVKIIN